MNKNLKILLTAPPMINSDYTKLLNKYNNKKKYDLIPVKSEQTLSETQLLDIIDQYDGWVIGDDPATSNVINKGINNGKLKFIIKWGIGIDNIDLKCCKKTGIKFSNTPGMFNDEVSNLALTYLIMLSRHLHIIHHKVKYDNQWYKPKGNSIKNKIVTVIGYGNIGRCLVNKLLNLDMKVKVYDPFINSDIINSEINIDFYSNLEKAVDNCDYLVITCSLTETSYHLVNENILSKCNNGVYVINISRGKIIDENSLLKMLKTGYVQGAALDVFENEPSDENHPFKNYNVIFGSHNGSNTYEAVDNTNHEVIKLINKFI